MVDKVITTLKDVKDALKDIPDEFLEKFWFGLGEGSDEDINIISGEGSLDDEGFPEIFTTVEKKYPQINELVKFMKNIGKAQEIIDRQDDDSNKLIERLYENGEELTSDFFDKK